MKFDVKVCGLACLLMAVHSNTLFAQFSSKTTTESSTDPRTRRANREKAVAMIGPGARDFVETYGDEAVAAIFAVMKATGSKLAEFHASGELGKLPRPRDLLRVIAKPRYGDDVAMWAIHHAGELADVDCFDAYLAHPLEYAMGLNPLQAGAASVRATRLNPDPPTTAEASATPSVTTKFLSTFDSLTSDDRVGGTACACLVIMFVLALWRKKRSASY